jgi:hypothetical protein
MEASRQTGLVPAAVTGDTDVLIAVDEEFFNVYDVPFIIVNMIDGQCVAEVEASFRPLSTESRVQEAKEVARRLGQRLVSMSVGDREYPELEGIASGVITLYFTPDLDGGL